MEREAFLAVVQEAVDALPEDIRGQLTDVVFIIEDRPEVPQGKGLLLGLYQGIPLTAWGRGFSGKQPDKIIIYRENIEVVAETPEEIPALIRETVWHEIGHYIGLDHAQIRKMERRWRVKREGSGKK